MAGEKSKISFEPISAICAVVLLIACVTVIAVDVNAKFIEKNETVVEYGDSVTVDYVGSLYTYYDQNTDSKKAVIFDTSIKSVGENKDNLFTNSFNKSDSDYKASTITLGDGKFLADFERAVMGAKVGETVKVKIDAANAYPAADTNKYASEFTFNNGFVMSATDFTTAYGKSISEGTFTFEDKNQMPVTAVRSGSDVTVTYDVAVDNEFTLVDSALGKVVMKITAITGNVVTYTLTATGLATGSDVTADGHTVPGIEMICLSVINSNINLLGVNGTEVVYNNNGVTDGKDSTIYNQDLYFVIKVISKN